MEMSPTRLVLSLFPEMVHCPSGVQQYSPLEACQIQHQYWHPRFEWSCHKDQRWCAIYQGGSEKPDIVQSAYVATYVQQLECARNSVQTSYHCIKCAHLVHISIIVHYIRAQRVRGDLYFTVHQYIVTRSLTDGSRSTDTKL